jgi:uncharacterized protein (DUF3084 family)
MHLYTVAFIIALLAFGGVAAYLGDVVGYRLGRRRVSFLRLRPRTTARLIGILVGILVPLVTVGIGYLGVGYVRIALTQLDEIRAELASLQRQRDAMQQENRSLKTSRDAALKSARRAEADAQKGRQALGAVRSSLVQANERIQSARAELGKVRAESGQLRVKSEGFRRRLDATTEQLKKADDNLREADRRLKDVEGQRVRLGTEVGDLRKEQTRLKGDVEALKLELETQRERLTQAGQLVHDLFARLHPIFDLDAELVRGVVKRPDDMDTLKNDVVALYVLADRAAEAGGAAKGDNDRFVRAVRPVPRDTPVGEEDAVPESRVLGEVVRQLWQEEGDFFVVQVTVARRTFPLQQVYVGFHAAPNRLVFRKGETIVKREIRAHLDESGVFEQLWLLIADPRRSEVRKQAQSAGLLPAPASERFGEVEIRELFRAAKECANRDQPMTVRMEAADDTYTVGPLTINIVTAPSEAKP